MARWRDAISREQAALTKLAEAEAQLKLEREIASREIRAAGAAGAITGDRISGATFTAALAPSAMPAPSWAPPAPPAPPVPPADELLAAAAATAAAAAAVVAAAKAAAAKEATTAAVAAAAPAAPSATAPTVVPSMVFGDVGDLSNFTSQPPAAPPPPATTTRGAEGFPDLGDGFVSFVSASSPAHSSSVSLVSAAAGDEPALPPPAAPFDQLAWAAVPPAAMPTEDEQLAWALRESNRMAAETAPPPLETAPPPPSPWVGAPGTALSKAIFDSNAFGSDDEDEDEDEDEDNAGPADEGLTKEEARIGLRLIASD